MENIINRSVKNEYLILFIIYLIAHGLVLTCNGIFWDDWVLYDVKSDVVIEIFRQAGGIWAGYFHVFMLSLPKSILCYRLLVFLSFMFSGFFLNEILKKITEIGNFSRLIIVIFFLIFPVNSARIALICAPSALCYFSFFFAFWIIAMFTGKIFLRLFGACLFFFSFTANSLLSLYSIVLIFIFYNEFSFKMNGSNFKKYILKNVDLIFLPILFMILKSLFFHSSGLYQDYNTITAKNIIFSPITFFIVLKKSFFGVFYFAFDNNVILSLTIAILISKMFKYSKDRSNPKEFLIHTIFGLFIFFLSVFPYIAVGKIPQLDDWDSRHQLLIPLGAAFIIYNLLKFLMLKSQLNYKIQIFIFSFIISNFLLANISNYFDYQKDWYKQLSLIENFKSSEIVKNNSTFLIHDNVSDLNAMKRIYRFYEYTGIMKKAFRNEKRLAVDDKRYKNNNYYKKFISAKYNMSNYILKKPEYIIYINRGTYKITLFNFLKLEYNKLFNTALYLAYVKDILNIQHTKL